MGFGCVCTTFAFVGEWAASVMCVIAEKHDRDISLVFLTFENAYSVLA
jgi:hypothetical protein